MTVGMSIPPLFGGIDTFSSPPRPKGTNESIRETGLMVLTAENAEHTEKKIDGEGVATGFLFATKAQRHER